MAVTALHEDREVCIMNFVLAYLEKHGYAPSYREIAQGIGLSSTSSINYYIQNMINSGKLESDAAIGSPRALRVPGYRLVKCEPDEVLI